MVGYLALIRKDADSDYGVDFPDFPGCVSAGTTIEAARAAATEALALHLEGLRADGDAIPEPSDLDEVMADPANRDAVAFLVDATEDDGPLVRVNVSLRQRVLDLIDHAAARRGQNRSTFLTRAAQHYARTDR